MSFVSTHTGEQIDSAIDEVLDNSASWSGKAELSDITDAINALDVSDSAVAGKYISSVSEVNGKIQVTRADLPQGGSSTWGEITGDLSDQVDLKNALDTKADSGDIPTKVSDLTNDSGFQTSAQVSSAITSAIGDLNKSGSPHTNQYISVVRQSAGVIDTQSATLPMHTAGNGITVSSGTVSAKLGSGLSFDANGAIQATGGGGSATWGSITGDIYSQSDLAMELGTKVSTTSIIDTYHGGTGTAASTKGAACNSLLSGLGSYDSGVHSVDGDSEVAVKPTSVDGGGTPYYKQMQLSDVISVLKLVTGSTAGIKIAKVASVPASPDPDTIYLVQE